MCFCGLKMKHRGRHKKLVNMKSTLIVANDPFRVDAWEFKPDPFLVPEKPEKCACGKDWAHTTKHDPVETPKVPNVVAETGAILVRIERNKRTYKLELTAAFFVGLAIGSVIFTFFL